MQGFATIYGEKPLDSWSGLFIMFRELLESAIDSKTTDDTTLTTALIRRNGEEKQRVGDKVARQSENGEL